jgi:hypothetical protein
MVAMDTYVPRARADYKKVEYTCRSPELLLRTHLLASLVACTLWVRICQEMRRAQQQGDADVLVVLLH